ncbi:MAG TPA: tyrosine-type recombinase/integrase [Candidatus Eisenbacteria bacterium]|nr:tyrosine-type recombinase/integrase [Candidatus Eisenbacteria bacterium]
MLPPFEQFSRERQYLTNVSPATLDWYKYSLKWLRTESPTEDELKDAVLRMREKGLKATGCNSAIRAINAYLHWNTAGADVKCSPACKHLRIPQLKEPQLILPTFTTAQVTRLVNWRPKATVFWQRRLHLLILFLLDTGCRISEALSLRVSEIDFDNLLATLDGKGRKQRVVPFSFELRRAMFRYISDFHRKPDSLLLATRNETKLGRRVMLRAVKNLCDRLGIQPPSRTLHAFRHTFAVNYIRRVAPFSICKRYLGTARLR